MPVIDIIAIAIIGLFSVIGIIRGLVKSLFKTFSLFLIVFIPILVCGLITPFVVNSFGKGIEEAIVARINSSESAVEGKNEYFYSEVDFSQSNNIKEVYEKMGISSFISYILASFTADDLQTNELAKPIDVIPSYLTEIFLKIITFVALMAVTAILLLIVKAIILGIISKIEFLKVINRIGGLLFGFMFGVVLYSVVFYFITSLPLSFLSPLQADIASQIELSKGSIGISYALSNSFIIEFFKNYIGL